jgi:hypothetical protein
MIVSRPKAAQINRGSATNRVIGFPERMRVPNVSRVAEGLKAGGGLAYDRIAPPKPAVQGDKISSKPVIICAHGLGAGERA